MSKRPPWPDNIITSLQIEPKRILFPFSWQLNSEAKSSKNWLHIGKHALLESSEKGKWNAKLSESDSDRELRGDYFYQLQYGKTSAHSKLRKKQSIERKRKQWLKGWIKEQLREYLWCKTEGESRGDNCLSKRSYGGRLKKNFCERKSVMARMMAMLLGLVSPSSMEGPSSSGLVKRLIGLITSSKINIIMNIIKSIIII